MKKIKDILTNALYGMLRSYEGKRFIPSLIVKLAMSLASAIITAFFANTLFSENNTLNQIFAALFFYFLITAVSGLITEIKRGGIGGRLKNALGNMVRLKPPALWLFIAAIIISLFLPYAFVLSLAAMLFMSAVSGENSMLLAIKNAVTKGKNPERNGKGLAGFTSGLIACGLAVCILSTIMSRGNDGWKIEWNDDARSRLQSDYDDAGFSYQGLEAKEQGYAWAKFFIPFDLNNTVIFYENAVMCKVTEMYMDINNNVQITLYISNDTDKDIGMTGVSITAADGDSRLFDKSFEIDLLVQKTNVSIYTLTIPSEELDFNSWSSPKITDFKFSYDNLDY